jgi:hypothetical protein
LDALQGITPWRTRTQLYLLAFKIYCIWRWFQPIRSNKSTWCWSFAEAICNTGPVKKSTWLSWSRWCVHQTIEHNVNKNTTKKCLCMKANNPILCQLVCRLFNKTEHLWLSSSPLQSSQIT